MAEGNSKRPQFGNRYLEDPEMVFKHNAWDNVEWDEEQEQEARQKVANNTKTPVPEHIKGKYETEAYSYWDAFYTQHQNRFFKDRHWLFTEFPELEGPLDHNNQGAVVTEPQNDLTECKNEQTYPGSSASYRILEVGCGAGNTVFPVLKSNNDSGLFMYGCDLSETAVSIVQEHTDYDAGRCHAFVCDVSADTVNFPFPDCSLDVVVLIFILSAVHPDKMQLVLNRLSQALKPGGIILFRDYGRYDMAQLRFKDGQCLSENFYVRGDGTRVYFFTQEDLRDMFTKAGLKEKQNCVDRRLQVNRGKQLKMYRVWIQCKYFKPLE